MATCIHQVELTDALRPLEIPRRYAGAWVLVRFRRQPLGWVRCRRRVVGGVLTPDVLHGLIAEQLGAQALDALHGADPDGYAALPPHRPTFSVVICTREHPDLLDRQLRSTLRLAYPRDRFEVIVVDNAPVTGGTRAVCHKPAFAGVVRYVLEPRKGLDYARNAGWQAARHEIIAYTDDDAAVDEHWLSALGRNYADPGVGCVTGITFPLELETGAQVLFEKYGGMQRGFARRVYRPGTWNTYFPLGSGRYGAGVNLSLRRSVLEAMGGFDPALDVGSLARGGGDLDIMARALRDGHALVYDPAAVVWHQHRKTMKALRKQMFDYGFGFTAYVAKHLGDLELGNQGASMLRRWARWWGRDRLVKNLKLAATFQPHFPVHLILLETLGGLLGLPAYARSVARVGSEAVRDRRRLRDGEDPNGGRAAA